jgi:predicted ester cyclase
MRTTKLVSLLSVMIAFCFASCGNMNNKSDNSAAMEKNKESMKKVSDMWSSGNTEGIENYVAANMVDHNPMPEIKSTGLQALKDMIAMNHAAFPDMKSTIYSIVAEGDLVVMHFNMKGTNTGAMGSMPATNKVMDVNGVDIVRFADGKGVEHWGYYEESKMMTQLGLMQDMSKGTNPATAANEGNKTEEKK